MAYKTENKTKQKSQCIRFLTLEYSMQKTQLTQVSLQDVLQHMVRKITVL